jgi:hypothetical protein
MMGPQGHESSVGVLRRDQNPTGCSPFRSASFRSDDPSIPYPTARRGTCLQWAGHERCRAVSPRGRLRTYAWVKSVASRCARRDVFQQHHARTVISSYVDKCTQTVRNCKGIFGPLLYFGGWPAERGGGGRSPMSGFASQVPSRKASRRTLTRSDCNVPPNTSSRAKSGTVNRRARLRFQKKVALIAGLRGWAKRLIALRRVATRRYG